MPLSGDAGDDGDDGDRLVTWHLAIAARLEMQLQEFDWDEAESMWRGGSYPRPLRIRWASTKTGVIYLTALTANWLKTRAIAPPADFSADVWQGYDYMTPAEVLQAIINRVRDYGHEL